MASKIFLVLACISTAVISTEFLTPYEIVNSIALTENHPNQSDLISKYDFYDDEFTGDAVAPLNSISFPTLK